MSAAQDRQRLLSQRIRGIASPPQRTAEQRADREEPTSHAQRRLWFLEQLQQSEAPYTLHAIQSLSFPVSSHILQASLSEIAARHEVLRTTFEMAGDSLVQKISPDPQVALTTFDLTGRSESEQRVEATRRMEASLAERFDLARGPLMRVALFRLSDDQSLLFVVVHHIIFDGYSFQIFFRELEAIYGAKLGGQAPSLPPPRTQYAAFARQQAELLSPERIAAETEFWRDELDGISPLDLPFDRPRRAQPSFRGNLRDIQISPDLAARLRQRASMLQTTVFTVILGGLWAALNRLCQQDDFGIGVPVTGRDTPDRQDALGFFVDTVVVRPRAKADPTSDDVILAARAALGRSLTHRVLPFEMVVQHLAPERDLGLNPFFQVGCQLMEFFTPAEANGQELTHSSAMFDLGLDLWPRGEGLGGRLEYNSDLFDTETADLVVHAFVAALNWIVQPGVSLRNLDVGIGLPPAALSILTGPKSPPEAGTCLEIIARIAALYRAVTAIECAGEALTYDQLLTRVRERAGALREAGVRPGTTVALSLERSIELFVSQLAVWTIGGAFACIDPAWPPNRREAVLDDLQPALLLDPARLTAMTPQAVGECVSPQASDAAYLIFTSGSTGQPKGVVLSHGGLANVAQAQCELFGLRPGRRVAQLSSPTFDASVFETVLALCSGATLVVAPAGVHAGEELAAFLAEGAVDTVVLPPSILATMPQGGGAGLQLVCAAGEPCPADLRQRFAQTADFWNLYGPTETTIWATSGQTPLGARLTIGRPIANTITMVVDPAGRPVPVGVPGELLVCGPGVAQGYLHRPEQTAERFVLAPPPLSLRAYRTGDVVRQTRGGELVFIGRADRQVKVRGLRVELDEVEAELRAVEGVAEALVEVRTLAEASTLVAYVQLCDNAVAGQIFEACRLRLSSTLPAYMSPSHFVPVAAFPRSASGKIDRKHLPDPEGVAVLARASRPPLPGLEAQIAELMAHVLRTSRIGAEDDFFHIGGHSLAAVQLAARLRATLGVDLTVADLFAHRTVEALASRIAEVRAVAREDGADMVSLRRLPRGQVLLDLDTLP